MAVIYLRHPLHGAKVATLDLEAEYDMQNGWEPFDPISPAPEAASPAPEPVNSLAEPPRRRRREI